MGKVISVPTEYAMYEVADNVFEMLTGGQLVTPPQIVLEMMSMNGQAKKLGTVGTLAVSAEEYFEEDDSDEEPPEGEGPWLTGK